MGLGGKGNGTKLRLGLVHEGTRINIHLKIAYHFLQILIKELPILKWSRDAILLLCLLPY